MTTDVGDTELLTLTVTDTNGDLANATSVAVTITDPSGNTATETPTNPSTGLYQHPLTFDEAGRWTWVWATTGPASVQHDHRDVTGTPRLRPLATTRDLEDRIGTSLTAAQRARAGALLADASAAVRGFCRQSFDLVADDVVVLRPVGTQLRLPQRPVVSVTSVVAVGSNGIPDLTLPGWTFDGIELINLAGLDSGTFVSLPAWWEDYGVTINTYRVTYTHGHPVTPDDIRGKVCQMVNRVLTADTLVEGVTQETIGQYSRQWQQATGSAGLTPILTKADRDDLIAWGYRRTAGTIQTNVR